MWSLEEADINGGFAVALTIKTYTEIQLAIIFMHTEDGQPNNYERTRISSWDFWAMTHDLPALMRKRND